MDLHDAIEDHVDLHKQVSDYAAKPDGTLDPDGVKRADACELGKWLPAEGAKHQALPEHPELTEAHVAFHAACADVVRQADARTLEENALGSKGPLHLSLVNLCFSISRLNVKIQ